MKMKKIPASSLTQREPLLDNILRPKNLSEFIGQQKIKERLRLIINGAKKRKEPIDHILFVGPPGVGKTTLAFILAEEQKVSIKAVSAPSLQKTGDLVALLTNAPENGIIFIDEIHRLSSSLEEILYSAMEDRSISFIAGKGPGARVLNFKLPPFTLVGATTRPALLSNPLRDRFGFIASLDFYSHEEMVEIIKRSQNLLGIELSEDGVHEVAKRSRGVPRIANRLLKRIRDYIEVEEMEIIDKEEVKKILDLMGIDDKGLDDLDRKILFTLRDKFSGGPVGIKTLAAVLNESPETIEVVYEPYLLRIGFIQRTPRGRIITPLGLSHLMRCSNG
jgi:Holliday junction DNA helicase RuvB